MKSAKEKQQERERKLRALLRRQFEEWLERLSRLRAVGEETTSILLKAIRDALNSKKE